jgi:mono/diheme cytochrome c family protein
MKRRPVRPTTGEDQFSALRAYTPDAHSSLVVCAVVEDSKRKDQAMKSQKTLMEPKSGCVVQYARRGVLSTLSKFMLAGAMLTALLAFSLSAVSSAPRQDEGQQDDSESRVQQGLAIAPVPLDLHGKNRALVGLGSYLVNAQGDCAACHTNVVPPFLPGGNPFLGEPEQIDPARYLIGGRQFGAPGVGPRSRNLTPDPVTGLPAGYTFEEFLHVMRTGEDLKHLPPFAPSAQFDLLQAPMPWPGFAKFTDRDMRAIYEYLRAIPSRAPGTGFPQ